jgi:hypothetical protein
MIRQCLRLSTVALVFYFSTVVPAAAYIDPGSGSFLIQIIGAAILGAMFYARSFRSWLKSKFSRLFGTQKNAQDKED